MKDVDARARTDYDEHADGVGNVEERGDTTMSLKTEYTLLSLRDAPVKVNRHRIEPANLDQNPAITHAHHTKRIFIFSSTSRQGGEDAMDETPH